jgi:predicted permease
MPESPVRRLLAALLPAELRRNVFEPALHDLDLERVRRGHGRARGGVLLLFLDCWRLAPAEVFSMFLHDLRHAFRLLWRDPGFTITAVLTLTLGVGANVAVFAVVNALLLRPLPYVDADRLVILEHRDRRTGITKEFIAMGDFVDLRARQSSFEAIAAYGTGRNVVYVNNEPLDVSALGATPDLLSTLRVVPYAGRALQAEDGKQGAAPVVMLGYAFWQQQLGGDPTIVGRSIKIGVNPLMRQVVGIAPPGFRFPATAQSDVIFPLTIPAQAPAQRKSGWTFAVGRLKPGVTFEQATTHLNALSRQMEQEHPTQNQGSEYFAVSVRDAMVGDTRSALLLLLAAVGLVLLIACANVANLLAARSLGRRQEMSIRVALGAGRGRLLGQLLAESIALAGVAGTCAVLFARWAIPALVSLMPSSVALAAPDSIRVDAAVLLFAAGISLFATVAFSLFSALGFRRDYTAGTLVSPGRVTTGTAVRRATSTLVAAEIALALVLLTGAGLVLRSFSNLLAVDPGFHTAGVLTANFAVPVDRYREIGARVTLQQRMFAAVARIPGVEAVGVAAVTPLTGNNWTVPFERADRPVPAGQRPPDVGWQSASAGYFRSLRIPLRAGRLFSAQDDPSAPPVVIISEAIQDQFFKGDTAVGRKAKLGDQEFEIIGVVGNIRRAALTDTPRLDMYFSQAQQPSNASTIFVRTTGDTSQLATELRAALRGVESAMLLRDVRSMDEITRESMQVTRLALSLLVAFAAAAIALAAVGIYGVMSYAVRQRMREMGTRMALGATPGGILWLVLGHGARIAIAGTLVGVAVSFVAGRALQTLLFGTSPNDPKILLAAAALLLVTALAACYFPARRATRVDPVKTLAH